LPEVATCTYEPDVARLQRKETDTK